MFFFHPFWQFFSHKLYFNGSQNLFLLVSSIEIWKLLSLIYCPTGITHVNWETIAVNLHSLLEPLIKNSQIFFRFRCPPPTPPRSPPPRSWTFTRPSPPGWPPRTSWTRSGPGTPSWPGTRTLWSGRWRRTMGRGSKRSNLWKEGWEILFFVLFFKRTG